MLVLILLPRPARREGKALKAVLRSLLALTVALPLFAQSDDPALRPPADTAAEVRPPFRSSVELQFYNFGNFFQAGAGAPEQSVNAFGAAYRALLTQPGSTPDLYGRLSVLRYAGGASETSYTGQVGLSKYGSTHWYDVSLDHTQNGFAYDIDDTRASADITSVWGHYSYPITSDWRVGAETFLDWQRFDVDDDLASDYRSLGAQVRYRGFGDVFQPRAGYVVGERDARTASESLDDRYWYLQVGTEPTDGVDVSLRFRDRTLDYSEIDRTDDRRQWLLRASIRQSERISWNASYAIESVDSSRPGRDFDRNTAYVGVAYGF